MNQLFGAVLFDCDGTILDSKKLHRKINRQISKELGFKTPLVFSGRPANLVLMELGLSLEQAKIYMQRLGELELAAGVKIFPKTNELLKILKKRGLLTALLTNRPTFQDYFKVLEEAGLKTELIDYYINCDVFPHWFKMPRNHFSTKYPKPDSRFIFPIFKKLIKVSNFPSSVIMIGDHHVDFEFARNCHFNFIGLLSGLVTKRKDWASRGHQGMIVSAIGDLVKFFK